MATMMGSPSNRSPLGIDNPVNGDGFWLRRKFKAHRRTGAPTGGRLWRRAVRRIEDRDVASEISQSLRDFDDEIEELMDDGYYPGSEHWEWYLDQIEGEDHYDPWPLPGEDHYDPWPLPGEWPDTTYDDETPWRP